MRKLSLIGLLLAAGCAAKQDPAADAQKAIAAYAQAHMQHPESYKALSFEPAHPFSVQDSAQLLLKPFEQKDDSLLSLRRSGVGSLSLQDSIVANLKASLKFVSHDTTQIGVSIWHNYRGDNARARRSRFVVYKSGRVALVDTAAAE